MTTSFAALSRTTATLGLDLDFDVGARTVVTVGAGLDHDLNAPRDILTGTSTIPGNAGDFVAAVEGYTKLLGAEPQYSNSANVIRAVWPSGAFVSADESKLTSGWSKTVEDQFAQRQASAK